MDDRGSALPRVMIAAPHGRSGKTVLTLGLLRAFEQRGVAVQPFKKGPDYIDTGWHTRAARRESRNLDCFFMEPAVLRAVLGTASDGARLGIIEGAMGLFDGLDLEGSCSSAEVAKLTATPVVLVVDVTRMTRTVAAVVLGCMQFDPAVQVAGVILNRVQGARQENLARQAVERFCGIPVLGAVPKDGRLSIPDRHLGLLSSTEAAACDGVLDGIAQAVSGQVDLDALLRIADAAPPLDVPQASALPLAAGPRPAAQGAAPRIAVVRDRAFCFYYPENLRALEAAGAELVFADSLEDAALPAAIDGVLIGGGFPEVFAERLQANEGFRASVRECVERGVPVHAECGGLMYLGRRLHRAGASFEMAGAMGFDSVMEERRQGHGYAVVEAGEGHPWLAAGTVMRGHEHHHSRVVDLDPDLRLVCACRRGHGVVPGQDGLCYRNAVAGYTHLNALAAPAWAPAFVEAARACRKARETAENMTVR